MYQVSPKVELNRKKMQKFLNSLHVTTRAEIEGRRRFTQELYGANSEFETIRNTASSIVFARDRTQRHDTVGQRQTSSRRAIQDPPPEKRPRYIPASKYPLPMQPPQFVLKDKGKNAARVMNLSKMRATKPIHSQIDDNPLPDEGSHIPTIDVERIDVGD